MSYTVLLNSKNRANVATTTPNDATYYFNWDAFEPGQYKLTWNIIRRTIFGYNMISPVNLFLYYPFDSVLAGNIYNYATGAAVQDAAIVIANTGVANNRMTCTAAAGVQGGAIVNNVVPTGAAAGISLSFWFKATTLNGNYSFLATLQDVLGFPAGNRFFVSLTPANTIGIYGQYAGTNTNYDSPTVIAINTVYHIAITITAAGAGILYINGAATAFAVGYPAFANIANRNFIAQDPAGSGVIGWLQEFRLYTRVITPAEAAVLYASGYYP